MVWILLGQWLTFETFGDYISSRENKPFKLFFQGPLAEWEFPFDVTSINNHGKNNIWKNRWKFNIDTLIPLKYCKENPPYFEEHGEHVMDP